MTAQATTTTSIEVHRIEAEAAGSVGVAAAAFGVPDALRLRWDLASAHQVRHLHVARTGRRVVGVALAVHRPLTAYEKVAGTWTGGTGTSTGTGTAVGAELLASVVEHARRAGAVAVKVELDPRAVDDLAGLRRAALAAGFAPVDPPAVGAAFPSGPLDVPDGLTRWLDGAAAPRPVPYYRQTTDFTCGPVATGIALAALGDPSVLTRDGELQLWREATTLPGCDPFGLAVAADRRGRGPRVLITTPDPILLEASTQPWERDTREFIQRGFRSQAVSAGLDVQTRPFSTHEVVAHVADGGLAVLLIDEHPMHAEPCPHWVTLHAVRGDVVVVHDPWTDADLGESWLDAADLPVRVDELDRLNGWGEPRYHAALLLR